MITQLGDWFNSKAFRGDTQLDYFMQQFRHVKSVAQKDFDSLEDLHQFLYVEEMQLGMKYIYAEGTFHSILSNGKPIGYAVNEDGFYKIIADARLL